MSLVLYDEGKVELLTLQLMSVSPANAYYNIFLFVNNIVPDEEDTLVDYTKPTWAGYADLTLLRANWGGGVLNTHKGQLFYGPPYPSWTVAGGMVTVYGYVVQSLITNNLLWGEAFAVPRTVAAPDTITVEPQMTLDTDPDPL